MYFNFTNYLVDVSIHYYLHLFLVLNTYTYAIVLKLNVAALYFGKRYGNVMAT